MIDDNEPPLATLLRNSVRMMISRGYTSWQSTTEYDFLNKKVSKAEFDSLYNPNSDFIRRRFYNPWFAEVVKKTDQRNLLSDIFYKDDESGRQIAVLKFATQGENGVDEGVAFLKIMQMFNDQYRIGSGVLVTSDKLTPAADKQFQSNRLAMNITHFTDSELRINPLIHEFVPPCRILSVSEKKKFIDSNNLRPLQLPRNHTNDTVVKYLGGRADDIIEYVVESLIPDLLVGSEVFHRYIRDPPEKKKKGP
jgi:DNA-directed RNA polymerase subunit H (RpoH/RPB5)